MNCYKLVIMPAVLTVGVLTFSVMSLGLSFINRYAYLYPTFQKSLLKQMCISGLECLLLELIVQIIKLIKRKGKSDSCNMKSCSSINIKCLKSRRLVNAACLGIFILAPLTIIVREYVKSIFHEKYYRDSSLNTFLISQLVLINLYNLYWDMLNE